MVDSEHNISRRSGSLSVVMLVALSAWAIWAINSGGNIWLVLFVAFIASSLVFNRSSRPPVDVDEAGHTTDRRSAFDEGWKAGIDGAWARDNPYNRKSQIGAYRGWQAGWDAATPDDE